MPPSPSAKRKATEPTGHESVAKVTVISRPDVAETVNKSDPPVVCNCGRGQSQGPKELLLVAAELQDILAKIKKRPSHWHVSWLNAQTYVERALCKAQDHRIGVPAHRILKALQTARVETEADIQQVYDLCIDMFRTTPANWAEDSDYELSFTLHMIFLRLAGIDPCGVITDKVGSTSIVRAAIILSELEEYQLSKDSRSALSASGQANCPVKQNRSLMAVREQVMKVAFRYQSQASVDFFMEGKLEELELQVDTWAASTDI
ncbi:hypothetical protein LIA77_06101 [Sarocladium implicatum]|nr:hypothetical protein LIA77_06101 [Sarocladium implicatum]